jgi:hypothetical protein
MTPTSPAKYNFRYFSRQDHAKALFSDIVRNDNLPKNAAVCYLRAPAFSNYDFAYHIGVGISIPAPLGIEYLRRVQLKGTDYSKIVTTREMVFDPFAPRYEFPPKSNYATESVHAEQIVGRDIPPLAELDTIVAAFPNTHAANLFCRSIGKFNPIMKVNQLSVGVAKGKSIHLVQPDLYSMHSQPITSDFIRNYLTSCSFTIRKDMIAPRTFCLGYSPIPFHFLNSIKYFLGVSND